MTQQTDNQNENIYLKAVNEPIGAEGIIYVDSRNLFEKVNLCDTYGDYGQKVGCYNAGCYALDNSNSTMHSDLMDAIDVRFSTNFSDILKDLGNTSFSSVSELIEELNEINDNEEAVLSQYGYTPIDEEELKAFAEKWVKENENHLEVTAYTFFNGSNFESIITENQYFDNSITHVEIDEEEAREVEAAIENRTFVKKGFGKDIYEYGDYYVIDDYCQGHWAKWEVVKKEYYELNN